MPHFDLAKGLHDMGVILIGLCVFIANAVMITAKFVFTIGAAIVVKAFIKAIIITVKENMNV